MMDEGSMCVTMPALLNMVKHPAIAKKINEIPRHPYLNLAASIGLEQSGTTGVARVLLLGLTGLLLVSLRCSSFDDG